MLATAATKLGSEQPTQCPWVQEPVRWGPAGVGREGAQKPDNSFFPIQRFHISFIPLCQNLPWVMVGVACNNGGEGGGWVEERELLTGPPRVGVQGSYPGADF